jgi:uncharacterized protein YkwD
MRALGQFVLLALLIAVVSPFLMAAGRPGGELLVEHNRQRSQRGLEPLEIDEVLCSYAQVHAEKMAARGSLFHSSMASLSSAAGAGSVAENIAAGQDSEREACRSWMGSHGHKQNILGRGFKRVGFGVKEDRSGRKYWCAVFSD